MLPTMLAAAVIAAVYALLIGRQLRLAAGPSMPRRLARAERAAAAALLAGALDRASYRVEVETLAALDAVGRPLKVPAGEV